MGWCIAAALAVFAAAHVVLVLGLARGRGYGAARAVVAFLLPPLAPWWGYRAGLRIATIVWCAALASYAVGVFAVEWFAT